MTRPKLGRPAPDFSGQSDTGETISLSSLRGRWAVLYFYPKANSYGCSIEAQQFEEALPEFQRLGAQVIGISTGGRGEQADFRERCHLSFPLLPDPSQEICRAYGVIGGLTGLLGLPGRASFLIDPEGNLVYELRNMLHTVHVMGALDELERRARGRAAL